MGSLSSAEQRKLAYFHALGRVMTEANQAVYETKYKSSHNIKLDEIWSDQVGFANTYNDAVTESQNNDAVSLLFQVELDEIYGSNGQAYAFVSGGTFKDSSYPILERGQVTSGATFIRPWISPVDVPDSVTNEPSNGYSLRLFRGDDATSGTPGSEIYLTIGAWSVDYYAGIIHFAEGYTPSDLGWGTIKATIFYYSGDLGINYNSSVLFNSGTSELIFNSGETNQTIIDLSSLDNSDAFTLSHFDSGTTTLIFNSGETNETLIDLSYLDNSDAFKTATYRDSTSTIVFNSGLTTESYVDLSTLKTISGTTSSLSPSNVNMTANNTSYPNFRLACATPIISGNVNDSMVMVFVNGIQINVGDTVNDDAYFSPDGGFSKRTNGEEQANDYLYWNYVSGQPVSGYELSTNDKITFLHLTV